MSLAYKLWKIGNVLSEEEIKNSIKVDAGFKEGDEPIYLNIDFTFENAVITNVSLNRNAVSEEKLFFTKKIGGTSNAYYLYPNISIQNDKPTKGLKNILNTLKYSTQFFCSSEHKNFIIKIIEYLENKNVTLLTAFEKDNYIILLSINGKTLYEMMPEVWDNYYQHPFTDSKTEMGFDIFTNEETEVGFKTDFKVFSYDQYHKSLNHRLNINLPLSKQSAKNIKYAWMYILDNLVFNYKYKVLQYIVVPNVLNDDMGLLKKVLNSFVSANQDFNKKRTILDRLKKEESKLKKELEKLHKKRKDSLSKEQELKNNQQEIERTDLGIIRELNEQAQHSVELKSEITLDYLFVNVNTTYLSFEIIGTLEDVIPSQISKVSKLLSEHKIEDIVKLGAKNHQKTYLQDYFGRDELHLAINRSTKENYNSINKERIFLAQLLLTDTKIKRSNILKRFEHNRNYNYENKARLTKDGNKEWIEYPGSFIKDEQNVLNFLTKLNKIQED